MKRLDGLRYGSLGFALAFVALPLYVTLPAYYAQNYGVPLAALGLVLLGARLADALVDPWIGRLADGWLSTSTPLRPMVVAALLLAISFVLLFFPPALGQTGLLLWCTLALLLTYLGYSVLSVMHQAWGARLGGDGLQQTRVVAWREGMALGGVLCASVLPSLVGLGVTSAALAVSLLVGLVLLRRAPRAEFVSQPGEHDAGLAWRTPGFKPLLAVFLLNGIAAAIPATLLLFFVRDRLQTPQSEALYLASYFVAAALSLPLWLRMVARLGQARAWAMAMLLALVCFGWAAVLSNGDQTGFLLVCLGSGVALGADLAIPGAMLARVVQRAGLAGHTEGAFFGWWNFATKLNLAVAAGLALPLLQSLGYTPGQRDPQALQALTIAYCVLPCVLKLGAVALLFRLFIQSDKEALCAPP
ncbi:MFS transporter [Variovorax sp. HJSM1_2]|uniref:MFS transporter n=1 Tax=Variovorax sp. HJSM1_2 TaxID=3366263 RepID=UPI003BE095BC